MTTGPGEFEAARLYVTVESDTAGLGERLQRQINRETARVEARVRARVDAVRLRAEVEAAARRAAARQRIEVEVRARADRLRDDVQRAARAAARRVQVEVQVRADVTRLRAEVERAARVAARGLRIDVPVRADDSGLRASVERAVRRAVANQSIRIPVAVDSATVDATVRQAVTQATAMATPVRVPVAVDDDDLADEVDEAAERASGGRGISLPVHVDGRSLNGLISGLAGIAMQGLQLWAVGTGIANIGAALVAAAAGATALVSALSPAIGVLSVLPALAGAAAQSILGMVLAFGGIGDAVKAMAQQQDGAAEAAQRSAQQQEAAAERVRAAQMSLAAAQRAQAQVTEQNAERQRQAQLAIVAAQRRAAEQARANSRAIARAEEQVANARERAQQRLAAASQRVTDSERRLQTSQAASLRAQEALTRAREQATERLEDLNLALRASALDEEAAGLAVERARERLDEANRSQTSTHLDRREADLAYRQALQRLEEVRESNEDLRREAEKTNRKGVEGSDEVVRAREQEIDAQRSVIDAERDLADARADAQRETRDGQRAIIDAEERLLEARRNAEQDSRDNAQAIAEAQRAAARAARDGQRASEDAALRVAEAQRGVALALRDQQRALTEVDAAAQKVEQSLAGLSPPARRFAEYLFSLRPLLRQLREDAATALLPDLERAIRLLVDRLFPSLRTAIIETSEVLGGLATLAAEAFTTPQAVEDFGTIAATNTRLVASLGLATIDLGLALQDVMVAAGPLTDRFGRWIVQLAESIRLSTDAARASGDLGRFLDRAGDVAAQVWRILSDLVVVLGNVGSAAAPAGQILLDSLEGALQRLRDLTSEARTDQALRDYFMDTVPAVEALGRLLNDVFMALAGFGADPNVAALIDQIRTDLLPAVVELIGTLLAEGNGQALIDLLTVLVNLVTRIVETGALEDLARALTAIADGIDRVASMPGGEQAFDALVTLVAFAGPLLLVQRTLGRISGLLGRIGGAAGAGGAGAAAGAAGGGLLATIRGAGSRALRGGLRGGIGGILAGAIVDPLFELLGGGALGGAAGGALQMGAVGAGIGSVVPGVGTAIGAAIGAAIGGLGGFLRNGGAQIATDLFSGFINGVTTWTQDSLAGMVEWGTRLLNRVRAFFGIESPSTVFAAIGRDLIAGLMEGLTPGNLWERLTEGLSGVKDTILREFGEIRDGITSRFTEGKDNVLLRATELAAGAQVRMTNARDWVSERATEARDALTSRFSEARDNAHRRFDELRDGVNFRAGQARDWVNDRSAEARDWVTSRYAETRDNANRRFDELRDGVNRRMSEARDWVSDRARELGTNLFTAGVGYYTNMGGAFDEVKRRVAVPVARIVTDVYGGLRNIYNRIAGIVNAPQLDPPPPVTFLASGGHVRGPGTSTSDSIPAMLSNNEYVIPARRVREFGVEFFDRIRDGSISAVRRARGGLAQGATNMLQRGGQAGLNAEQLRNARIIMGVGRSRGISEKGLAIAIATALQESGLRNINYGDRDSIGLFQQRPSQGWGTRAQIMDPAYSASKFFQALVRVRGWEGMSLTRAAQAVQRSAFPNAYAKWEDTAREVVGIQPGVWARITSAVSDAADGILDSLRSLVDPLVGAVHGLISGIPGEGTFPAMIRGLAARGLEHVLAWVTQKDQEQQAQAAASGPHSVAAADELSSNALRARDAVLARFGRMTIGGWGRRPNATEHDDYIGGRKASRALDFMTRNISLGNAIADFMHTFPGATYSIWNRRIRRVGGGWRPYTGRSPHTDHVHTSFLRFGGLVRPLVEGLASSGSRTAGDRARGLRAGGLVQAVHASRSARGAAFAARATRGAHGATAPEGAEIPSLAQGATVLPRSGGTIVRVAEAGQAESIVDTGRMNLLLDRLLRDGAGGSRAVVFHEGAVKVYNPAAEPASESVATRVRRLGEMGVFGG